jgi:hypothetical protein
MGAKHIVCQGATCMCNFGSTQDKLKVKSHKREYINDNDGKQKLIASTKEVGGTFEKNTFGPCKKQPTGSSFKKCQAVVTEWTGFYENVTLVNKGKILLEDSKATCPIGGAGCIKITFHGQVNAPSASNVKEANKEIMTALNPLVDMEKFSEPELPNYT